jgi:multidrug efflux pump subunit AcrA (membrane-fusion protein)
MRPSIALMAMFVCSSAALAPVSAHAGAQRAGPAAGDLGATHFPNSGAPGAQQDFLRGLLLLHSFEYDAARRSFQAAQADDSGFAMAYWGEALTYNHPIWGEQDLGAARSVLAKLAASREERAAKAPTARERAYLASVEQLYGDGDKVQRDANYSAALGALARQYPDDLDARSFYALSILGLTGGRRDVANYMRAAAEAEAVYAVDKYHPGALHYLIHAYDDPIHARLGLPAARLYGKVAPAASHAQHMPSHIFFALGMWDEAIEANVASLTTARAQGDRGYHSLLWLAYAYLQEDRRQDAERLIRSVANDVRVGATKDNRSRLAYARAMWLVETRGTEGPHARSPVDSAGIASIGYFAAHDFARGITAAAAGKTIEARAALARLRARINEPHPEMTRVMADWHDNMTSDELEQAKTMAAALDGTIEYYRGDRTAGLARVREAISMSVHMDFEYGPPWSVKPLDELLGELLLADGRREEAAAAFQRTLAAYPNRRLALEGLAASRSHSPRATRQELIGAWRLISIEILGPNGTAVDPFYNADPSGILIYDPSGWMSVQIVGQPRPAMEVPASRPAPADAAQDARVKAAVLDTYYAYFGTWEYDEATSTVTHHLESSLIPGETGMSYSQKVAVEGGQLIFTVREETAGGAVVRKKVWKRIPDRRG